MQVAIWMEGCQGDSVPSPGVQMLQVFVNSSCVWGWKWPLWGLQQALPHGLGDLWGDQWGPLVAVGSCQPGVCAIVPR